MFEWDDSKAKKNEAKHSISFVFATRAFDDENRITVVDDREARRWRDRFDYGEVRASYLSSYRPARLRPGLYH
ncbi:protein of unknown function DUF497 (plasmid) [Stanieria cyanosphaera PCC 7437]|uniref:BrnT family toxin n=1 Tax=Stanieria cyanosphaera (strain ATCC 29371 / PCC 7437) TaxID=111780 RepID=K9Y1Q7_STAC7|nr:protein of unknown function DUF497 [Stanieria cyanosphaera PCC 7437]